jgi:hypothetical protein
VLIVAECLEEGSNAIESVAYRQIPEMGLATWAINPFRYELFGVFSGVCGIIE